MRKREHAPRERDQFFADEFAIIIVRIFLRDIETVIAGGHPIEPELRKLAYQYTSFVRIENNVWIGAGAIILPGVTIGENSVIGAGSVVTKDIPANVVAVGNPCKVLRPINEKDRQFYFQRLCSKH